MLGSILTAFRANVAQLMIALQAYLLDLRIVHLLFLCLTPCPSAAAAASKIDRPRKQPAGVATTTISTGTSSSALLPASWSAGSTANARVMVSRRESAIGASTRSVDVQWSKPPPAAVPSSRHRRSASMYGGIDDLSRVLLCIQRAIKRHEDDSIRNLLATLCDEDKIAVLKKTDSQGMTPMHHAVQERQLRLVNCILLALPNEQARHDVCTSAGGNANHYAPIHLAALRGDLDVLRVLLQYGASPNAKSKLRATPLHLAASKGHTAACQLLLSEGSHVNAATKTGNTALLSAVHNRSMEMVRLLLDFGANPKITTESGLSALGLALSLNAADILLTLEVAVKEHGHRRTPSTSVA